MIMQFKLFVLNTENDITKLNEFLERNNDYIIDVIFNGRMCFDESNSVYVIYWC